MNSETKQCQNCKKDFIIEPDDFSFYEKMKVPAPTFCPLCRFQRRCLFRADKVLYKRECDLCKKSFISTIAPDKPYIVYCPACWFSDKWDAGEYSLEYNTDKNFFEQLKELFLKTPQLGKVIDYATIINSDYCTHIGSAKNCTLVFNSDFCENVLYSSVVVYSKDIADCYMIDKLELCYEVVDGTKSSKCFFCKSISSCVDVVFSRDCTGCIDCFACCNLKNKSYCAFNKQYTKEAYKELIALYNLHSYEGIKKAKEDSEKFFMTQPKRCTYGIKNLNVTGNYVFHSKNAKNCWCGQYYEDCAHCQFSTMSSTKGTYDLSEWGNNVESCVDCITVGEGANNIKYCFSVWANVRNVEYSMMCNSAVYDCFGCNCLRKKQYCILNKQYDKETYIKLREKIIEDMNNNPYVDKMGRIWKYGEFMPYDLSLYDYNETFAMDYFPLSKEESIKAGLNWRDVPKSIHNTTFDAKNLPDSINDVNNSILKEIIKCSLCNLAYKILPEELNLLKRFSLSLPRFCYNCRHTERIKQVGSPDLYERKCDKCGINITTPYSKDRPEIVYCEKCYQQEII